ncbi:restriction endonuclease subunit S [Streptomyces sp. NEAU-H22]|uniref:restriction endonuclease subunit S n=1 Tax=Streptomyces sp. NEAU-H22 TaxID=2994655 RepID=UPI002259C4AF|nr:restriction endonuclease subunit S [Streptomyces sp. NEAU-H22]MCX3287481.1 restriction endonuclease subunit S [Streptomyces sp. NEAU-H22]
MSNSTWTHVSLAECVTSVRAGVSVNSEDRPHAAGEVGVLKTSSISGGAFKANEHKTVLAGDRLRVTEPVLGGSVLFSRMNTPLLVGEACYVESDHPSLFLPDRLWQIRTEPSRVDARWLAYVLQSTGVSSAIKALATGTSGSMKNIAKRSLLALSILLPPLDEQRRIAEVLNTLEAKVRATERLVEKLDLLKVGLSQEAFASGRAPLVSLGDVAEVRNGSTPSRARRDYWECGAIAWLASGKVNDYRITAPSEFVTQRAVSECHLRVLPVGSVLVGMIGQGKTRGMAARLDIPAAINQNLAGIVPGPRLLGGYLHHYLVHSYQMLRSGGRGSNQDALTTGLVAAFRVPFPSIPEQRRVANLLDVLDLRIKSEREVVAKLTAQKEGLLADLLTGCARVPAEVAS